MLSNAYFLAKFRFDTAENEPAKNLQKLANFANCRRHTTAGDNNLGNLVNRAVRATQSLQNRAEEHD